MRKCALALAVLAVCAGPASAQNGVLIRSFQNIIVDTMSVAAAINSAQNPGGYSFTAESTAIIDVGRFFRIGLMIRAIPAGGDTTTPIRLAVQIRAHLDNSAEDSTNTFYWMPHAVSASISTPDSFVTKYTTSAPPAGAGVGVWPGEMIVAFNDPARGRGAMKSNEFFGAPDGCYIPLIATKGDIFWAPYMSVRVRVLQAAANPKIVMSLIGME